MRGMMTALACLAMAGCTPGAGGPTTTASAPITVRFTCDRGPALSVRFDAESATITPDGVDPAILPPITLPQAPAASGFLYQSPTHSLRGKGREVQWTTGRMVPITCRQAD